MVLRRKRIISFSLTSSHTHVRPVLQEGERTRHRAGRVRKRSGLGKTSAVAGDLLVASRTFIGPLGRFATRRNTFGHSSHFQREQTIHADTEPKARGQSDFKRSRMRMTGKRTRRAKGLESRVAPATCLCVCRSLFLSIPDQDCRRDVGATANQSRVR